MKFWDSSAVVPLLCHEQASASMLRLYSLDADMLVWGFTRIEVLSALCKHAREGSLSGKRFQGAKSKLQALEADWTENIDFERVRERAERLLSIHALSAVDALQLGAALISVEEKTRGFGFVTLDDRLATAADREGFSVIMK